MNFSRFLLVVLSFICIAIGTVGGLVDKISHTPNSTEDTRYIYIKPGSGLIRVSWLLKDAGLIQSASHFRLVSTLYGKNSNLRAGEFEIKPHATTREVLRQITDGKLHKRVLVIPEGSSNAQISEIISHAPGLTSESAMPEEGYLLPDSYFYHYGTDSAQLIASMKTDMDVFIDELWDKRPANFLLKSKHELLTLASIVEEETGVASERSMVAAVFLNRLKKGMRLQSDPTVIYGISQGMPLNRRLTSADLRAITPYNTYRINRLPPGPISNPGKASLEAVIFADSVDYIYFVADGSGGHAFAKTLSQHNRNVKNWRKIRDSQ